jgi:pyruvate ferredoxin oxidoreductase delta subunit
MLTEDLLVLTSASYAGPGDAGQTGSWRVLRPVIDYEKCAPARTGKPACFFCWLYCPDGVVSKTLLPQITLEYCKGCGICAEECPSQAITMVEESSFSAVDDRERCSCSSPAT